MILQLTLPIQILTEKLLNNNAAKSQFGQNIVRRWKQVLVNQHPENNSFNSLTVVPDKLFYKDATNRNKFHERDIFSYSIPKGIRWKEFNSCVKTGKARLFGFPGANSKLLPNYIDANLENNNSNTVIIHI